MGGRSVRRGAERSLRRGRDGRNLPGMTESGGGGRRAAKGNFTEIAGAIMRAEGIDIVARVGPHLKAKTGTISLIRGEEMRRDVERKIRERETAHTLRDPERMALLKDLGSVIDCIKEDTLSLQSQREVAALAVDESNLIKF